MHGKTVDAIVSAVATMAPCLHNNAMQDRLIIMGVTRSTPTPTPTPTPRRARELAARARRSPTRESWREEVCAICLSTLGEMGGARQLVILGTCGHPFCHECLSGYWATDLGSRNNTIKQQSL